MSSKHAERLEQIVIALIAIEIGSSAPRLCDYIATVLILMCSSRHCDYPRRLAGLIILTFGFYWELVTAFSWIP